jgi:hypothetical protein
MKELNWDSKSTKKHIEEAYSIGLELIGHSVKGRSYRKYKFIGCGHIQDKAVTAVRKEEIKCNECHEDKLKNIAKSKGLEIVGASKRTNRPTDFRMYKFTICGHVQEIGTANVVTEKFHCQQCLEEIFSEEAVMHNLKLLSKKAGREGIRLYRFNECGHEEFKQISKVRFGAVRCNECLHAKELNNANAAQMEIIGKGRTPQYRLYRFIECGHKEEIRLDSIHSDFKCKQCHEIKIQKEAAVMNMKMIGDSSKKSYRKYKFLDCGHEEEKTISQVRNMSARCNSCEETSRNKPSNIYLLKLKNKSFEWLKLGYAQYIDIRIKQYHLPINTEIELLKSIQVATGQEAHISEASIHTKYKNMKMSPSLMKLIHANGFNECYPMMMKETLLKELANLGNK